MKHITIAIITLLLISCNCKKKADAITTIQKNESVQEYVDESTQRKEEMEQKIQYIKYIKDIEAFVDGQVEEVLNKNQIGKTFHIQAPESLKDGGILEYKITYIGNIDINKENIRFLYVIVYTGNYEDSKRADSVIILYNKDKEIGGYYVGGAYYAPFQISSSNLIIKYDNNSNCNQTTTISFKDSIPQEIFIECTKDGGDFYSFSKK